MAEPEEGAAARAFRTRPRCSQRWNSCSNKPKYGRAEAAPAEAWAARASSLPPRHVALRDLWASGEHADPVNAQCLYETTWGLDTLGLWEPLGGSRDPRSWPQVGLRPETLAVLRQARRPLASPSAASTGDLARAAGGPGCGCAEGAREPQELQGPGLPARPGSLPVGQPETQCLSPFPPLLFVPPPA